MKLALYLSILLLSSTSVFAFAGEIDPNLFCSVSAQDLHLTSPAQSPLKKPVSVKFEQNGNLLTANFEVLNDHINAKPVLGLNEYPYKYDVVELFISVAGQAAGNLPYYEFELSPYDQTFQVQINDLKKPFINNIDKKITHYAEMTANGWRGQIVIPLENLNWDGDVSKIRGNAYSIFGVSPKRSYWSLFGPNQPKPNFHQPKNFQRLLNCW